MNIFHLDKNPQLCAKYHCDKHVVKMILETGQMLCTAYQRHYGLKDDLYKPAYPHHPMTKWVGNTLGNYFFTMKLFNHLLDEYNYRYNKWHKSSRINLLLNGKYIKWHNMTGEFTTPPLCMPDEYKLDDYIQSYKNYYIGEKMYFAKYNYSETPYWLKEVIDAR
jgi:hypothetical protein